MAAKEIVHLVNPMWDAIGGAEMRTLELYRTLRRHGEVQIWSEYDVAPELAARVPIQRIGVDHPRGGVLVVIGAYFEIGPWLARARPRRVRFVVNTQNVAQAQARFLRLLGDTSCAPEVAYASELLAKRIGMEGTMELSMIDLERFVADPGRGGVRKETERFVVGRLSRDVAFKHHPEDPALYARLVENGADVRIMGGTVLGDGCPPGVSLLAAGAAAPEAFLRELDCFYYRTAPEWFETFGRVVFEAMACGLPVVCERRGGYRDLLVDGRDVFLFETGEEAFAILRRLQADRALGAAVGAEARRSIERLYAGLDRTLASTYFGEGAG